LRDIVFGSDSGFKSSGYYREENGGGDVEGESLIVAEKIPDAVDGGLNGNPNGGGANSDDGGVESEG
jgi:hypothetical protein